jgi:hypothetical protein
MVREDQMPTKTKPPFTLPARDKADAADLVRHLLALRAEIERVIAMEHPELSEDAREHLVQAATAIVAGWYNSGRE